jgi:hypothetical protein
MGSITRFDLGYVKKTLGISHLIETGTWYGEGVQHGLSYDFSVQSCELNSKFFMIVSDRFRDNDKIEIFQLPSHKFISIAKDVPSVYWLDAHLPGLYTHHEEGINFPNSLNVPLETELNLLLKKQTFKESVFIIDDLRIYHPQYNYEGGNIEQIDGFDLIGWCASHMTKTHHFVVSESDQGYLVAIPKIKVPEKNKKEVLKNLCYVVKYNCD